MSLFRGIFFFFFTSVREIHKFIVFGVFLKFFFLFRKQTYLIMERTNRQNSEYALLEKKLRKIENSS